MLSIEIRAFTILDYYEEAFALWSGSEGIGLHAGADSRAGIERYLERNSGLSFVAREGGALVGAVLCGHDGRRGYLHHLAVAVGHRRRGIGEALARECLTRLRAAGIDRCHLFVHAGNHEAGRFWSRTGWRRRDDILMMSRDVESGG